MLPVVNITLVLHGVRPSEHVVTGIVLCSVERVRVCSPHKVIGLQRTLRKITLSNYSGRLPDR